jgi:protein associated with RNAse G/E
MKPGDVITVKVLHADGQCFRSWQTEVEEASVECIVTLSHPGSLVDDARKGPWKTRWHIRAYYWLDQPYNLLEIYDQAGLLEEIYVNVASLPVLKDNTLEFTDHELDVSLLSGQPARIVDEDEFAAAITKYGYSPEFQAHCRQAAAAALQLARNWTAKGLVAGR